MRQKKGFTLFELLIALFIGTLLIMAGSYAIRMGLFSMERDETWFNESTKEKAVYDFFWQQVSSLYVQNVPKKKIGNAEGNENVKTKENVYFTGKKDFLTFVSPLSFTRHYGQGLTIANYKIKVNDNGLWDLVYSELKVNPTVLITLSEESEGLLRADKDSAVFFKDCDKISFAYLDTVDNELDDKEDMQKKFQSVDVIEGTDLQWKEEMSKRAPLAIKLLVSKYGKEHELVSSIMVMY
ncbi:hypothetical protein B188_20800 [Candidatus Brocadiaceae bacterium B188]|nr:prepilin-type N-terminal cleavage/methylation domain-containing protein [Candidatus Brocadia sapporoensis]QQR67074.1 MAG: prepilin-type N-terminal cleavage/methylation domain-containing protein [Candidatus Brocadia sp.]RZV58367.1 MAG: prepilin-type N-terminal cleavage/methylation domain-containing protein [Candidatus Brocadia sp. BROELEC01]TWU54089.1 hypothetical protein B188_20800 [Candidatus Brocadiaceae bacterium B188]